MKIIFRKGIFIIIVFLILLCFGCGKETSETLNTESKIERKNKTKTEEELQTKETKVVIDMADRTVEVPKNIKKVYCTSPVGTIITYTISPNLLAGLNYELSDNVKEFMPSSFTSLPVLGGWFGQGNNGNMEEIAKVKPDIIINAGTIVDKTVDFSDNLQKKLGIPVVFVGVDLKSMDKSYKFLGDLLDQRDRTDELGNYVSMTLSEVKKKVKDIPQKDKIRVYYAETSTGLQTDPAGSPHTQVLDLVGGINVADVKPVSSYGRAEVTVEQLIKWNPDLIITGHTETEAAYDYMQNDSVMKNLRAIQNGNIYEVPNVPFSWFDRPPSANTILGLKWTAQILYPEIFKYDLKKEVKKFYKLYYSYDLTEAQIDRLLKRGNR
ncbi:ABC transporter substrate-binding protein [Anaerosacchariphilus polymeriproducens]|nr:ABC transporter substrate-binding protein [Anaerosacchariphilus polymeriproducens]